MAVLDKLDVLTCNGAHPFKALVLNNEVTAGITQIVSVINSGPQLFPTNNLMTYVPGEEKDNLSSFEPFIHDVQSYEVPLKPFGLPKVVLF